MKRKLVIGSYMLSSPYKLYDMYNDFAMDTTPDDPDKALIEFIRDNYKLVWDNTAGNRYTFDAFETLIKNLFNNRLEEYNGEH